MTRRLHTPNLHEGDNPLDPEQAHHARVVLRLTDSEEVEIFDDAGRVATGVLVFQSRTSASVRVDRIQPGSSEPGRLKWTVASAVPKGERADWMVEKLSELGADEFIPLAAARSVVLPEGKNKRDRWSRLATESAKQSRRHGVMRIGSLTSLSEAVAVIAAARETGWCLSTAASAASIASAPMPNAGAALTLFIGPEGGWSPEERAMMAGAGFAEVRLTRSILRVETAAVAAAAVVAVLRSS